MRLRRATAHDADKLWTLRTESILGIPSSAYDSASLALWANKSQFPAFKTVIEENFYLLLESEIEREVCAGGFLDLANCSIEAMYVSPKHQGQGHGARILRELLNEARRRGMETVRLSSTLNAETFYLAMGFETVGPSIFKFENGQELPCIEMKIRL